MRSLIASLFWLTTIPLAGCVPLNEPGGLSEPLEAGLKSQSTLQTGPIELSPERRAQLAARQSGAPAAAEPEVAAVPEVAAEPEVEAAPEVAAEHEVAADSEVAGEPEVAGGPEVAVDADAAVEPGPAIDPAVESGGAVGPEPAVAPLPESSAGAEVAPEPPSAVADASSLPPPPSDADALAAIDRLPRRAARSAPTPTFGDDPSKPSERCVPADDPSSTPLTRLKMTRWGSEGGRPLATLATPSGEEFQVEIGDRVGPHGGLVVAIDTSKVIVYELRLDDQEEPTKVREVIKLKR